MNGKEILGTLNKPTIYIGQVMDIYDPKKTDENALKEQNSIRFTIPGVTDGIMKYPIARLIGNRTRRVRNGDTVFIIKQGSLNNIFFYMPMDISDFIGCAYDENRFIKLSENDISIKLWNNEIELSKLGSESDPKYTVKITNGVTKNKIEIEDDGTVNINGHLKVTV